MVRIAIHDCQGEKPARGTPIAPLMRSLEQAVRADAGTGSAGKENAENPMRGVLVDDLVGRGRIAAPETWRDAREI